MFKIRTRPAAQNAPYLARFGRRSHNDVKLGSNFAMNDQCYFDFNKESEELLLHGLSEKRNTELYEVKNASENGKELESWGPPQMWKPTR